MSKLAAARIMEFKLTSGDTILAELIDAKSNPYVIYYPLLVTEHAQGAWGLSNYLIGGGDKYMNINSNHIITCIECGNDIKEIYVSSTLKLEGKLDLDDTFDDCSLDQVH